ncbi:MAG TPA: hypothetical protein VG225_10825 [Terracidiphilus sp.]|nr:hypothetical protein [Terracidiphilus sp.]
MRWRFSPLILVMLAPGQVCAQRLTVDQFHHMLESRTAAHKSDADITRKVEAVELTEELTAPTLDKIKGELRIGPKTALALDLLSEISMSLDPPANEVPAKDPPDKAARAAMVREVIDFAAVTMHRMPDFLANRTTRSFNNRPMVVSDTGWSPAETEMHMAGSYTDQITYRDGKEVSDATVPASAAKGESLRSGLTTTGEFGPVLALVLTDSLNGAMTWSHWERMASGLAAVFHFTVPESASHYAVNFCSLHFPLMASYRHINDDAEAKTRCYNGTPSYHGSLAMDPATGAVLRIAIESDLPTAAHIQRAGISVTYADVEIGDRSYVCPARSVAITLVRYPATFKSPSRTVLTVNETAFTDYHRFGSTARIVTNVPTN